MKFSDLLNLPHNGSDVIQAEEIADRLPDCPPVVREVYSDHGRNYEFQKAYGSIKISKLKWHLTPLAASVIVECSIKPFATQWVGNVARRVDNFSSEGWSCIDVRPNIVEHWCKSKTWLVPPVFFDTTVVSEQGRLHLVEGHTRISALRGLISHRILEAASVHHVWLGTF
jgi:hypothetical protein